MLTIVYSKHVFKNPTNLGKKRKSKVEVTVNLFVLSKQRNAYTVGETLFWCAGARMFLENVNI